MQENYLMHYGVPGMKWGVRKARPIMGYATRRVRTGKPANTTTRPQTASQVKLERRKRIARRVAIGAAVLGAAAGTAYAVHRTRQNTNRDLRDFSAKARINMARAQNNMKMNVGNKNSKDWDTFNQRAGSYNRRQMVKIMKADKYGDADQFHRAVNAKRADNRRLDEKVNSAVYAAERRIRDAREKRRRRR